MKRVRVFAPATIGNIGPGFDVLGMAITGLGDTVEAVKTKGKEVVISEITGSDGTLPSDPTRNTAGIAAREVLKLYKAKHGVELRLHKNIPGTGLGSSAASAVASAMAVSMLLGKRIKREELIIPCAEAEFSVSGDYFIDNVAASLLGGVIVSNASQRTAFSIGTLPDLIIVVVTPEHKVLTKIARAVLPDKVPLDLAVSNMAYVATMVGSVARKDSRLFASSIHDMIVEPGGVGSGFEEDSAVDGFGFGGDEGLPEVPAGADGTGPPVFPGGPPEAAEVATFSGSVASLYIS